MNKLTTLKSLENNTKTVQRCEKVCENVQICDHTKPKKCRSHARFKMLFARTCASVRTHVRVQI